MSDDHTDEVKKHLKTYLGVFAALLVLTVVTVAVSTLSVSVAVSIAIALVIATVKGSLVGAYFMHLAWEKRAIFAVLIAAGAFFLVMMGLFAWSHGATLPGTAKAPLEASTSQPAPEGH